MKMEEWKECKLKDICFFAKDRINVSELNNETYISTENMIPNRGGITSAATLPTSEQTPSFVEGDILVSNIRPYFKKIWKARYTGGCSADVLNFKAKENISMKEFEKSMKDVYSTTVCKGTIDESPMAYKDTDEIKNLISETCKIKFMMIPKINIKAADGGD